MHWTRLALITLASGIVTSMTDWFFAGDWLHCRYTYPEVWREGVETRAIALTTIAVSHVRNLYVSVRMVGSAVDRWRDETWDSGLVDRSVAYASD